MSTPIHLVVFDFDGTLVDSNTIKRDAFYKLPPADTSFHALLDDYMKENYTATRQEILTAVCSTHYDDPDQARQAIEDGVQGYGETTTRMVIDAPAIDGAEDMFQALKDQGCTLALNSGTPKDALQDIVTGRDWDHWFSAVLGAPISKAENILALTQQLGITPQNAVMVGDRETDRDGATGAGCHFVGLTRPDNDFKSRPDNMVEGLADLPHFIERSWGFALKD